MFCMSSMLDTPYWTGILSSYRKYNDQKNSRLIRHQGQLLPEALMRQPCLGTCPTIARNLPYKRMTRTWLWRKEMLRGLLTMGKGEEKRRDDVSRCGAPSIEGRKKREERGEIRKQKGEDMWGRGNMTHHRKLTTKIQRQKH